MMLKNDPAPTTISPADPADLSADPAQALPRPVCPRAALRYCVTLLLLPLLAIPALILLGRSDFFLRHGASVWVRANDAVFDIQNRECDVLVYGDSTAMTGIDPELVENHTGFRTCNIAVTNAVLAVTRNLTLDHFLAHNAKPRVLLVQFAPDDFQAENQAWHQTIYAEGMLELLRHGSPRQAREVLLAHPQEAIGFAGYAAGYTAWYALKRVWFHTTHLRPEEDTVTVRDGSTFFTPPAPPRSTCVAMTDAPPPANPAQASFSRGLVAGFQKGYAERAGLILVNVAPIPSCDRNLAAYAAELNGVTSNSVLDLPIGLFNDGRHYTARGSEIVSALIARELNAIASRNPSIDDRVPPTRAVATLRRVHLRVHRPAHPLQPESNSAIFGLLVYPRELVHPAASPSFRSPAEADELRNNALDPSGSGRPTLSSTAAWPFPDLPSRRLPADDPAHRL